MKKIFLILTILFVSCFEVQVKPREINAQSIQVSLMTYGYHVETINGMKYGIWAGEAVGNRAPAMFVINLTKDALEVELLQAQINELQKKQNSK